MILGGFLLVCIALSFFMDFGEKDVTFIISGVILLIVSVTFRQ